MEDIVYSPIFLLITGIAEVLILLLVVVILLYLIRFIKTLNKISDIAHSEAQKIVLDIEEARDDIKDSVEATKRQFKILVGALTIKKAINFFVKQSGSGGKRNKK